MTTFPLQAGPSSPLAQTTQPAPIRPVPSDLMVLSSHRDSLAQHMRHCASAQGKWPRVQQSLQAAHGLLSPRIITVVALGSLMAAATISVAVILGWVVAV